MPIKLRGALRFTPGLRCPRASGVNKNLRGDRGTNSIRSSSAQCSVHISRAPPCWLLTPMDDGADPGGSPFRLPQHMAAVWLDCSSLCRAAAIGPVPCFIDSWPAFRPPLHSLCLYYSSSCISACRARNAIREWKFSSIPSVHSYCSRRHSFFRVRNE